MLSVGVVGNCHIEGIAKAVSFFVRSRNTLSILYSLHNIGTQFANSKEFISSLKKHDVVLCMSFNDPIGGGSNVVLETLKKARLFLPSVIFPAYHPYATGLYYFQTYQILIESPVGETHSALIIFGLT
jgi:hypothetical protein